MNCPYCQYPGPHSLAGARYVCGRCGESFIAEEPAAGAAAPIADLDQNVKNHRQMRQKRGMMSVRTTVIICAGFALTAFFAGLGYRYLFAKKIDLIQEKALQKEPYAPMKIPALRYLPAELDAVLAVQVQHLRKVGGLAEKANAVFKELGLPVDFLDKLPAALQTDWDNILEIAVGARFDQRLLPPQIFVVLHVKEPIDSDKLLRDPHGRWIERNKRELMRFEGPSRIPLVGWWPEKVDKYFLLALDEADFDLMPMKAKPDASHLPARLRKRIDAFVIDEMLAWMVLDASRLPVGIPNVLAGKKAEIAGGSDDSATIGITIDPDPHIGLWTESKNEDAAKSRREVLTKLSADLKGQLAVGGGGKVCFAKMNFDPATIAKVWEMLKK